MILLEMKEITLNYGEKELILEVVKNLEDLVEDPTDEDQIPCWAEVWPAARALAQFVSRYIEIEQNTSILELGAGMGLPGMVAAAKGADVVLTDYQPKALALAERNISKNNLSGISTQLADWRNFTLCEKFDIILASDVLYDPKFFDYLYKIIENNLKLGGRLLASHPGRKDTFDFLDGLKQRLTINEVVHVMNIEIDDPLFPHYRIRIHDLKR